MTETKTYCDRCKNEITRKPLRKHWFSRDLARLPIARVEYTHGDVFPYLSSETTNDLIAGSEIKSATVVIEHYAKTEYFDLCEDCNKEFLEFMKNER